MKQRMRCPGDVASSIINRLEVSVHIVVYRFSEGLVKMRVKHTELFYDLALSHDVFACTCSVHSDVRRDVRGGGSSTTAVVAATTGT